MKKEKIIIIDRKKSMTTYLLEVYIIFYLVYIPC
jgi:hypothetical protein